jgi:hypothetical protein
LLLLLDDAHNANQVRTLLPGDGHSAVLVTSRRPLTTMDGCQWFEPEVLDVADGVAMLGGLAGEERVRPALAAAERIVTYCGGLPLALRAAGAQLAARPQWSVTKLADQLADPQRRLDRLAIGDVSVRAAIDASFRHCTVEQKRALRLVAVRGVNGTPPPEVLEQLVDAQLLVPTRGDDGGPRYRLHELVRLFALADLTGTGAAPGAGRPR